MNPRVRIVFTLAAALALTATLSFARSATKSYSVTLDQDAKLSNGAGLKAGDYTVKIQEHTNSPEVEFYSQGNLVAKEQATVQTRAQKNQYTALELNSKGNTNVLTAIDPNGMRERLVFSSPGA